MWRRLGFRGGIHLRRVHYRILDLIDRQKHDGTPYENTERDWGYLNECSKVARQLHPVAADVCDDRRDPDPHLLQWHAALGERSPTVVLLDAEMSPPWSLSSIQSELRWQLHWSIPSPSVDGYDPDDFVDRAYSIEVWVEKSTQDDILMPLCRELGVALVTSVGFQSMTSAIKLLQRAHRLGKPTRIFYISDFDPAGDAIPVAVARQLEFWWPVHASGTEVKLTPLALTRDQVENYRLPSIPVKESDRRKAGFEDGHGEEAVELDALEARYPGTLAEIVRDAIEPYQDLWLPERLAEAEQEARARVHQQWEEAIALYRAELADLTAETETILARYQETLESLNDRLQAELAPLRSRLTTVRQQIVREMRQFALGLPARPSPDAAGLKAGKAVLYVAWWGFYPADGRGMLTWHAACREISSSAKGDRAAWGGLGRLRNKDRKATRTWKALILGRTANTASMHGLRP
jgi:hypothetical protein